VLAGGFAPDSATSSSTALGSMQSISAAIRMECSPILTWIVCVCVCVNMCMYAEHVFVFVCVRVSVFVCVCNCVCVCV
jgi:hypothetical protein